MKETDVRGLAISCTGEPLACIGVISSHLSPPSGGCNDVPLVVLFGASMVSIAFFAFFATSICSAGLMTRAFVEPSCNNSPALSSASLFIKHHDHRDVTWPRNSTYRIITSQVNESLGFRVCWHHPKLTQDYRHNDMYIKFLTFDVINSDLLCPPWSIGIFIDI